MRLITLVTTTQAPLYQGMHPTIKEAVEKALSEKICLNYIDLSHANLCHINLDGVTMHHASFKGTNLTGANMSEASFTDCDFRNATMTDACLCYTDIDHCNFRLSILDEADISMASLVFCDFEGWNTLKLKWHHAYEIKNSAYHHHHRKLDFNCPPILLQSGAKEIAIVGRAFINKDSPHTLGWKNNTQQSIIPLSQLTKNIQSRVDF